MAVKSIIAIDVDDSRFRAFQALYEKYETALTKAPGKWAEINKQIGEGGKTFQALTAAILAQTETLGNMITAQKGVTYEVERQSHAWQGILRWSKGVYGEIENATRLLMRWTPLVSGVLGIGGLYGLDKLAADVSSGRRSAMGLGVSYGGQQAFDLNFQRLVDPGFLSKIATLKADPGLAARQLGGLGISLQDVNALPTEALAELTINRMRDKAKHVPEREWFSQLPIKYGLSSAEEYRRMRDMEDPEYRQLTEGFHTGRNLFNLTPDTQKKWTDLQTQFDTSWLAIKSTLITGLTELTMPITHLSKALEQFTTSAMKSPKLGEWIETVAHGFEHLANLISGRESPRKYVSPAGLSGALTGGLAGLRIGGPIGGVIGAVGGYVVGQSMGGDSDVPPPHQYGGRTSFRGFRSGTLSAPTMLDVDRMPSQPQHHRGKPTDATTLPDAFNERFSAATGSLKEVTVKVAKSDDYWASRKPAVTIYNEAGSGIFTSVNALPD